jgi:hypothetical protein
MARYSPHVMRAISMVSCAFATAGIMEIANVRQINPLLMVFVLEAVQAYDPVSPIGHTVIEVRTEVMYSLCQI